MERCCKRVYRDRRSHPCSRNGYVERDGKWYCKQHDPEAVNAKDQARRRKWDWERQLQDRRYEQGSILRQIADSVIADPDSFPTLQGYTRRHNELALEIEQLEKEGAK